MRKDVSAKEQDWHSAAMARVAPVYTVKELRKRHPFRRADT